MPVLKKSKSQKLRRKLQRIGVNSQNLESWCNALGRTLSEILCLSDAELVSRLKRLLKYTPQHQLLDRQSSISASNLGRVSSDYSYVSMQSCPIRFLAGEDTWSDEEKQHEISRPPPHLEFSDSDDSFNARRRAPLGNQSTPIRSDSHALSQNQNFAPTNTMQANPTARYQGTPQQPTTPKPRWLDYSWSDSKQRDFQRNRDLHQTSNNETLNRSAQQQKLIGMVQNFEKAVDDFKKNIQQSPSAPRRASLPYQSPPHIPDYEMGYHTFYSGARVPESTTVEQLRRPAPLQFQPYRSFWDEFPSLYHYPTSPTLGGPQPMGHYPSLGPMQFQAGPPGIPMQPQARPLAAIPMPPGACGADSGMACCTCSEVDRGTPQNVTMGGTGGGIVLGPVGPPGSPVRPPASPARSIGIPVQPVGAIGDANTSGGVVNISLAGDDAANSFTVPLPRGVLLSIQVP